MIDITKLHIVQFKILKGSIENEEALDSSKLEFAFNVSYSSGFNVPEKLAKCDVTLDISGKLPLSENVSASAEFKFSSIFFIEQLEELTSKNKKGVTLINKELGAILAGINYSTMRGVLLTRLQGTSLQEFILPVIDPFQLLDK